MFPFAIPLKVSVLANDLSGELDLGEHVVTKTEIMNGDQAQCQALINRIAKLPVENYIRQRNNDALGRS